LGLIRSESRLVLAGVRHETVPAYTTHHAARHRTMLRSPILRQSRGGVVRRGVTGAAGLTTSRRMMAPWFFYVGTRMDRGVGAAARLPGSDCKDLAIQALAGSGTVSDLAARHGVSRKFIYQQTHKAAAELDDAFSSATSDDEVLFELAVTKAWLRQIIVGLALICRSSYRGVVEFLRDLLGLPVSLGCIHDVLQSAMR